jgi:hypothetical protein
MSFKKWGKIEFEVCQKLEGISVARHVDVYENEDAVSHFHSAFVYMRRTRKYFQKPACSSLEQSPQEKVSNFSAKPKRIEALHPIIGSLCQRDRTFFWGE